MSKSAHIQALLLENMSQGGKTALFQSEMTEDVSLVEDSLVEGMQRG